MNRDSASPLTPPHWVAGFMSGTSLDAVDAAMLLTDGERVFELGPVAERVYTDAERRILADATRHAQDWNWTGPRPDHLFRDAEALLTRCHGDVMDALLEAGAAPVLAGVHGQTLLHRAPPDGERGATLQILNAQALANRWELPVWHDFRSDDVAAGGQGAPLAPAYHGARLAQLAEAGTEPVAALNLGGVANITVRAPDGRLDAFDTGPANGPVDEWVEGHGLGRFDRNGALAARGRVHEGLLAQWLDAPWFQMPPPKSLDRYDFNASMARGLSPEDGAATLTELSARATALSLSEAGLSPAKVVVCGGGRRNPVLMAALRRALPGALVSAEDAGWRGDSVEAEAFAFLAARSARGLPISWPETTGVPEPMTGGRVTLPQPK